MRHERAVTGIAIAVALGVGGCSLLFDGNDLRGTNANGDMAGGGGSGGGDDMAGGGGGGAGGGGTGGGDMGHKLTLSFMKTTPVVVGNAPYDLVAGDFDHDGHLDVATANANGNSVSFAFGNGSGFGSVINVTVPPSGSGNGCSPYAIAAGRFDADMADDVVVTCTDQNLANSVYILKGSAARSFVPVGIAALTTTASNSFEGITVGDFNKDAKLDIAVASYSGNHVWIANGNGDGTFGSVAAVLAAGSGPFGVRAGDVNHDGRDDLVVFNYGESAINVFLQSTAGALMSPSSHATTGASGGGAIVDLDHDGVVDIVATDSTNDQLDVFVNSTSAPGTFPNAAVGYSTDPTPEKLATADFDNDGNADLVSTETVNNEIQVQLGNGNGTLGTPTAVTGLNSAAGVVVGDFTGDGLPDIVVCDDSNSGMITLVVNTSH